MAAAETAKAIVKNLFKDFLLARPVKTPLDFGHNENVIIESVDFTERKKDGIKVRANTFIRLSKINPEDKKVLASTEISYWDLDGTRDFVFSDFINQFTSFAAIISAVGGDAEAFEEKVMTDIEGEDDDEITKYLKKNAKEAQASLVAGFKAQVEDKIGDKSPLLKCKMVSNKGGYLNPATEITWILPMDSELDLAPISAREQRVREEGLKADRKAKPDATGKAPKGEAKVAKPSLASI